MALRPLSSHTSRFRGPNAPRASATMPNIVPRIDMAADNQAYNEEAAREAHEDPYNDDLHEPYPARVVTQRMLMDVLRLLLEAIILARRRSTQTLVRL